MTASVNNCLNTFRSDISIAKDWAGSMADSRSNSTDRCLNPSRLTSFGASLHLGQNTRQMPNFGSHSPHMSPRLHHFESPRSNIPGQRCCNVGTQVNRNSASPQGKLLDHRRSKSEQIVKMKRKDVVEKKDKYERTSAHTKRKLGNTSSNNNLMNDGLGPRTDKSGLATETSVSCATTPPRNVRREFAARGNNSRRSARSVRLVNAPTISHGVSSLSSDQSLNYNKIDVVSSSSCSSCYGDSSSETSEFHSDCQDDEEIALAMQAAEIANRNQIRAKFR